KLPLTNETVRELLLSRDHGVRQGDLEALAIVQRWSVKDVLANMAAQAGHTPSANGHAQLSSQGNSAKAGGSQDVTAKTTTPLNQTFQKPRIFVLRARASLFGHNAADWRALPPVIQENYIKAYDAQVGS